MDKSSIKDTREMYRVIEENGVEKIQQILPETSAEQVKFNIDTVNEKTLPTVIQDVKDEIEEKVTVKDVKVNHTSILSNKVANLNTEGVYNYDTNKLATESTVDDAINSLDGSATIATLSNNVVTLKSGVVETNGVISNSSGNDISLGTVALKDALVGSILDDSTNIPNVNQVKEFVNIRISDEISVLDSTQTASEGYALSSITEENGKLTSKTQIKVPSTPSDIGAQPSFEDGSATVVSESNGIVTISNVSQTDGTIATDSTGSVSLGTAAKKTALTGSISSDSDSLTNATQVKNYVTSKIESLDGSLTADSNYALASVTEVDGKLTSKTQIKIPNTPQEVDAQPSFNDGSAIIASESNNVVTINNGVSQSGGAISTNSSTPITLGTAAKKTALVGDITSQSSNELTNATQVKDYVEDSIVDTVESTSTTKSLSANMGKELQEQINNLKQRGRFLSLWNCTTGLPTTSPTVSPYTYNAGDYYIVTAVASQGGTNYKPNGPTYTTGVPSTTVESLNVAVNDVYYYDSTNWSLQKNTIDLSTFVTNVAYNSSDNKLKQTRNGVTTDITTIVTSVNGNKGDVTGLVSTSSQTFTDAEKLQARTNIGLSNVNNTSDLDKPISTATQTALNNKVDKVTGKGLSENDFTTSLKTKLEGIEAGAKVNVQSDWSVSDSSLDSYIKNKPTKTSDFTNDGDGTDSNSPFATQKYVADNGGKIDVIKVNGTAQEIVAKAVDIDVPTKTSDLTNDSNFVVDASYVHTDNNFSDTYKNKITTNESAIDTIEGKIPIEASSSNKLADKSYVGSSITSAINELDSSISATSEQAIASITITDGKITGHTKVSTSSIPKTTTANKVLTSTSTEGVVTWENPGDVAVEVENDYVKFASVFNAENTTNKVTTISSSSTDTQYPSAKCVYDNFVNKSGDETIDGVKTFKERVLYNPTNNLPSEYQEVEYIESSGTQWIDSDYYTKPYTSISAKLFTTEVGNKNWFGNGVDTSAFIFNTYSSTSLEFFLGSNYQWRVINGLQNIVGKEYTIDINKNNTIYLNNVDIALEPIIISGTSSTPLWLFVRYNGSAYISGRMFYFKIYENNTLVRNFIPCYRKSDTEIGLYDTVNNVFYTNQGTGTFSKGADVVSGEFVVDSELSTVATSGSYTDLSNKPTIPNITSTQVQIEEA